MQPEVIKLLEDVLDAASAIQSFVAGTPFDQFSRNDLVRSSVYFKFIVIGEALTQIKVIAPSVIEQISEVSRIVGFRNQIAHGYGRLDDEITWRIIVTKIPVLKAEVATLLGR